MLDMAADKLVVVDESGAHLNMTRAYARKYGGERIKEAVPVEHGPKLSLISAISTEEIVASTYGEWSTDGDIFIGFIENYLVPKLSAENTVVLDNIPFHKMEKVKKAIEATGAHLKFLPPYSPDFSPIENMWSKIKAVLRKLAPRTLKDFKKAIKVAFQSISKTDLLAWFKHCGYLV
jgi:transposase